MIEKGAGKKGYLERGSKRKEENVSKRTTSASPSQKREFEPHSHDAHSPPSYREK